MKNIKNVFYVLAFYLLSFSSASAHVKWFVDADEIIEKSHNTTPFYYMNSKEVWIWMAIVFVAVVIFGFLDSVIKTPKKLLKFGMEHEKSINRISQIVLGLFLITVSFVWKIIIVPDLEINNNISLFLAGIQALVGLMYVLNFFPRIASLLLVGFCVGVGIWSGPIAFAENLILLSLALYFFIKNSPEDSKIFRLNKHAVEFVRTGTGVSLIVLAFTEKLAYPELSLAFLEVHKWNFMQGLFPWYTDNLFVLSVGFAEVIFGILFVMGYLTRITTVLIAIFFALSVTTMFIQFGAWEVEDLVVYSAAIILLFYGHGNTKFFHPNFFKLKG
ncbi:MAG: hypothetical protein AAB438_03440 [Patescibacteria group bacterium]